MNCEEARELLGAFALDALPAGEARELRAHLATCADCAAEAADLRAVAAQLPALAAPLPAPAPLRRRVLAAIGEVAQPASIEAAKAMRERTRGAFQSQGPGRRRLAFSYGWGALAAAIIVAFAGLIAWNITLENDDGASLEKLASRATTVSQLQAHRVRGEGAVLYFADEGEAVLLASGLQPAGEGKTYQLWSIAGGKPTSLGLLSPDEGGAIRRVMPLDPDAISQLAITVEPAGGSDQPTTEPIFTADV